MKNFSSGKRTTSNATLFAAIVLLVVIAGIFLLFQKNAPSQPVASSVPKGVVGGIQNCVGLDRNSYGISSAVFESLPKPPKCFSSFMQLYRANQFSDDFFFSKNFFLQPEFYPNFESQGLSYWTSPIATHWGAIGFGASPFERSVNAKPGETVRTRFFFHSGFGVRTFQGLRLEAEFENPSDAQWVQVKLDSESENGFLLGPSFPKFDQNWAKAIDAQLAVLPGASTKTIAIRLKTKAPGPLVAEEWAAKNPNRYFNATAFVGEQTAMRILLNIS